MTRLPVWVYAVLVVLLFGLVGALMALALLSKSRDQLLVDTAAARSEYEARIGALTSQVTELTSERTRLSEALVGEQERNAAFQGQINGIKKTVNTLEKLQNTDPELLKKYSKVYFLNENYTPAGVVPIASEFALESRALSIHKDVAPRLSGMLEDAREDGIELRVVSAYRSFGTQAALKSSYTVTYGAGANRFSADQGYSEHQLGTTVDLTTPALGANFTSFDTTDGYDWLIENAHKYGFTLSYPSGNAYYQYEPWHWRYVGEDLARDLRRSGKHLYDLDQREIDQYLISLFD